MNEVEALASPSVFSNPSVMWMAFFMILLGVAVGWLLFKRRPDTETIDKLEVDLATSQAAVKRYQSGAEMDKAEMDKLRKQVDGHQTTLEAERAQASESIEGLREEAAQAHEATEKAIKQANVIQAKSGGSDKAMKTLQDENNRLIDDSNKLGAQLTAAESKNGKLNAAMKDQAEQIAALKGNQMPDDMQKAAKKLAMFERRWSQTTKSWRDTIDSKVRRAG